MEPVRFNIRNLLLATALAAIWLAVVTQRRSWMLSDAPWKEYPAMFIFVAIPAAVVGAAFGRFWIGILCGAFMLFCYYLSVLL